MAARFEVPVTALAALAERERVGALHVTLRPEPVWLTDEERQQADREIEYALAEAGLVDGGGRATVDVLDLLPLLTSASVELYGWVTGDNERTDGVLAAARGLQALVAVRVGDVVAIREVARDDLAEELVSELPDVGPGGGRPCSILVDELEAAGRSYGDRPLSRTVSDIVEVVRRPVRGSGELYAASRDEVGRYLRTEQPLHYADTDWGRYLNYTTGTGREAELHLAPGSRQALADALRQLAADLGQAPARDGVVTG
ncbi:ESX secretion-associated protein EspG [Amycolatopsis suaedae]|uniref:ESX secretion-associated protein EspG n=1 Tax=Amycolatopsis suaedae TaxID=2510978 RepID=A0A4Q7J9V1_9PSEU|nr:ESX secretion-associated protein EspG [Amycolatopsis suaedae]RZQ63726.1 ESX secretion-associated protein EspG [Amycolatopsis suaedae]